MALLRGFGGPVQDGIAVATENAIGFGAVYDVWFAVAGIVFFVAALGLRRSPISR